MTVSEGMKTGIKNGNEAAKRQLIESISRLNTWLEGCDYKGYDTFDGLNARYLRPLTFGNPLLRIVLQQGVRRFPINLRPLLGVTKSRSTKAMGFIACGYLRLFEATGDPQWADKAKKTFGWLLENQSPGYHGACWGNHFDYQSRNSYALKGEPSIVWTTLIAHAFLDAHDLFQDDLALREKYLGIAVSACEFIMKDLGRYEYGEPVCLGYFPSTTTEVHNANTLGGGLLARTYSLTGNQSFRELAERSLLYTAQYQREDGSWFYGEASNLRWVDNFHTAYVLDCFHHFHKATGSIRFEKEIEKGYAYWKDTFFLEDGTPRYYCHKTQPIDIQCSSQAIDTLVRFNDRDPGSLELAWKVAKWTIEHMQDRAGFFYYRRYPMGIVNKTPTLHWGQATMLAAMSALYREL